MKSLLRFELKKLFHARILYVCAAIIVVIILLFAGINKLTEEAINAVFDEEYTDITGDESIDEISGYEFEEGSIEAELESGSEEALGIYMGSGSGLKGLLTALTPYIMMVFGVFAAVYICGDFGNGTIKNIISKGYSRGEIYYSKYIMTLFVMLGFGLFSMLVNFIFGAVFWEIGSGWSAKVILLILIQLIGVAAYSALFCFFAALLKRMGPAMVASIAVPFAMPLILELADLLIQSDSVSVSDYWISGSISAANSLDAQSGDLLRSVIISIIYIAVFTVLGWVLARKREV